MSAVAVLGLGTMGARIAARLLAAGEEVLVWNRTPEKTRPLTERGALSVSTPAEAAARAHTLITVLSDPTALGEVAQGTEGIAAGVHPSLLVIEMSTVGPDAIAELAAGLPGGVVIDAPVLGSAAEAERGALTIFAGGPEAAVAEARPVLEQLGSVMHVGGLGSGAAAKLVANAALLGAVTLLGETLRLARALGLPSHTTFQVLATTPLAEQAERRRPAIETGEYPPRFTLALARKDAELILARAGLSGRDLRLLEGTRSWLAQAEAAGMGALDYTTVLAEILGQRPHSAFALGSSGEDASVRYDGLIVDLDGVVWVGGRAIEGAAEAIRSLRAAGVRLLFVTNDPTQTRAELAGALTATGVPTSSEEVMSAAAATARFLEAEGLSGQRAYVVGSASFRQEISDAGLKLVQANGSADADLVVVGGHDGFDYGELRAATRALASGAPLVAAGRDRFVPGSDGPEPATGAVLAAIETASGVSATVVGKPEPFLLEFAREALSGCERVAVVGDNLASDIAGAKRAGLDAILVLSGVSTEADVERAHFQPDRVVPSLRDLAALLGAAP